MPSNLREIVGDIRFRLSIILKPRYPETYGEHGFLQTTEVYFIKAIYGIDAQGHRGDYYIAPGDGGGPIIVSVSEPPESRWDDLLSIDGQAVRVLSVDLNGLMNLVRPRHTQFEGDMMSALAPA